jgi:hypothetical protein
MSTKRFEDDYHPIAIGALHKLLGYVEHWEDRNERYNAALDSAGLIGTHPCFIEVKLDICQARVSEVENKLARALREHRAGSTPLGKAMRALWDGGTYPLLGVIAASYAGDIAAMLRRCGREWQFAWQAWQCDWNGKVEVVAGDRSMLGKNRDKTIEPAYQLPPQSNRAPLPGLDQSRSEAIALGIGEMFEEALQMSSLCGFRPKPQQDFVTLERSGSWVRLNVKKSGSVRGLIVEVAKEVVPSMLDAGLRRLPEDGKFKFGRFVVMDLPALRNFVHCVDRNTPPNRTY